MDGKADGKAVMPHLRMELFLNQQEQHVKYTGVCENSQLNLPSPLQ